VRTRSLDWTRQHSRALALSAAGLAVGTVALLHPPLGEFIKHYDSAIVALSTLVIAIFTFTLWWTTKGTLTHLRREFEAEHRPWIPPDIQLASGWTWTPDGEGHVTLRFTLRNIGRSPATNVNVRTEIFPHGWGFPDPPAAQKKLSQGERRDPIAPGEGMGWTLFPDSAPRYLEISMSIGAAAFEQSRQAFKEKFPEANITTVVPIIVGCITYRFVGEQHQTGFVLDLHRIEPAHPHAHFALDPAQGDIPINLLRLADYYVGSAVID